MDNAFEFIEFNGGICTEEDYPYVSGTTKREGSCHQKMCKKVSEATPKSYNDVEINSEVCQSQVLRLLHSELPTDLVEALVYTYKLSDIFLVIRAGCFDVRTYVATSSHCH